jgi:hypothetical protein
MFAHVLRQETVEYRDAPTIPAIDQTLHRLVEMEQIAPGTQEIQATSRQSLPAERRFLLGRNRGGGLIVHVRLRSTAE